MPEISLGGLAAGLKPSLALLKYYDETVAHPRIEYLLSQNSAH
jgi:hypothetical protein